MTSYDCIFIKSDACLQTWDIKPRRNEIIAHNSILHNRNLASHSDKRIFEYIKEYKKI